MSEKLPIKGIRALSLIDYPKKLSAVVFLGGCNFRCPFCHNLDLAIHPEQMETLDENFVLEELQRRRKFLDGVVLTGGEPALYPALLPFSEKIKKMGYLIKLDTNGYTPQILKKFIEGKTVDFISMDIKTSLDTQKYSKAAGIPVDLKKIQESIRLLLQNKIDYEFRTTVIDEFVSMADIKEIARSVKKCKNYFLQGANQTLKNFTGPDAASLKTLAESLRNEGIPVYYR